MKKVKTNSNSFSFKRTVALVGRQSDATEELVLGQDYGVVQTGLAIQKANLTTNYQKVNRVVVKSTTRILKLGSS